jgi:hypothetical protein
MKSSHESYFSLKAPFIFEQKNEKTETFKDFLRYNAQIAHLINSTNLLGGSYIFDIFSIHFSFSYLLQAGNIC